MSYVKNAGPTATSSVIIGVLISRLLKGGGFVHHGSTLGLITFGASGFWDFGSTVPGNFSETLNPKPRGRHDVLLSARVPFSGSFY